MLELIVGIDIGGTSTKFGLVDTAGKVRIHSSIATDNPDINVYIKDLAKAIRNAADSLDEPVEFIGVGVGAPNGNYKKGTIEDAPNLPWSGTVPLSDLLNKEFGLPVQLTNDANAAAMGEMMFGGARGMDDFIVITLGTGLGSGFVANGQLIQGHDGHAGELGHIAYKIGGGRYCKCGKKGCLETYVSATGLKRTVYKLLADHHMDSELKRYSFDDLNTKMVADAAKNGDVVAQEAFEYTGKVLGAKLADAVGHTSPEAIFIMGGLAKAGDLIFKPTIKHFEKNLLHIYQGKIKVLPSELNSTHTPIIGAASLILKDIMTKKGLVI
ncbi:ROK family protein [Reichenbachiella carrageenanivorans]|uniref:ROK family protein n=1 Tax=Reichenbachiella carrageenanivorans TaxID=2979869 RepID=A0ABY6CYR4_9BACT|nr:ROK family protein [Reichenbachiella carrageenanivorans]UXX78529.1 ROK family protein [Reichenbachiella carrageenanivorans]